MSNHLSHPHCPQVEHTEPTQNKATAELLARCVIRLQAAVIAASDAANPLATFLRRADGADTLDALSHYFKDKVAPRTA